MLCNIGLAAAAHKPLYSFAGTSLCIIGLIYSAEKRCAEKEVRKVKRVKAACILQTLIFSQKPENDYSKEKALKLNHDDIEHYKKMLERSRTRYIIIDEAEQADGSIIVHVKKQYNDNTDVTEYFN